MFMILNFLFLFASPVATDDVVQAIRDLWQNCDLRRYAPVGTRNAQIFPSTVSLGRPKEGDEYVLDFTTNSQTRKAWVAESRVDFHSTEVYSVDFLWDSMMTHAEVFTHEMSGTWGVRGTNWKAPSGQYADVPLWRVVHYEQTFDILVYKKTDAHNDVVFRSTMDGKNKDPVFIGNSPFLNAFYSLNGPLNTLYIFDKNSCKQIYNYTNRPYPWSSIEECNRNDGIFTRRPHITDFLSLAFATKNCQNQKWTNIRNYPMTYIKFGGYPTTAPPATSSSITNTPPAGPITRGTRGTTPSFPFPVSKKPDIGQPVADGFVIQDDVEPEETKKEAASRAAVIVISPIVAVICFCLAALVIIFVINRRRAAERARQTLGTSERLPSFDSMNNTPIVDTMSAGPNNTIETGSSATKGTKKEETKKASAVSKNKTDNKVKKGKKPKKEKKKMDYKKALGTEFTAKSAPTHYTQKAGYIGGVLREATHGVLDGDQQPEIQIVKVQASGAQSGTKDDRNHMIQPSFGPQDSQVRHFRHNLPSGSRGRSN